MTIHDSIIESITQTRGMLW